jgi:hypothetical protein
MTKMKGGGIDFGCRQDAQIANRQIGMVAPILSERDESIQ